MLSWFYAFERFILITNKKVVKVLNLETISSDIGWRKVSYELVFFFFFGFLFISFQSF